MSPKALSGTLVACFTVRSKNMLYMNNFVNICFVTVFFLFNIFLEILSDIYNKNLSNISLTMC